MKKCDPDCPTCCDFCIWYEYNGGGWQDRVFMGDGFCRLNGENKWPEDDCLNFVCFNYRQDQVEAVAE